ncbi:MAG: hypothetical protein V1788_03260 [Nanoarchaeota archaeon]
MNKQKLMKGFFLLIILLIFSSCGTYSQDNLSNTDNSIVNLEYNDTINNLKVEVIWKPHKLQNDYIIGPAIIQFTNVKYGRSSTVVNNNFGILKKRLSGLLNIENRKEDSYKYIIQSIENKTIKLNYDKAALKDGRFTFMGATDEPFFFYDVDFDNKKELIVSEMFIGQRFYSTFKAYKLDKSQDIFVLEDDFLQITYKEPYISLDELSTVNPSDKTIELFLSSGAALSESKIYKLQPTENEYGDKFILKVKNE